MYFGTHTKHRIKVVLDLYYIGCYSLLGKTILFLLQIAMFILPFLFALSRFQNFEFSFLNCLKFIGWFILSHLILEMITNFIVVFLIRKKE